MTDTPQTPAQSASINSQNQPFTVLLMMPDHMRSDECCAADWLRRVWVWGQPTDQGVISMIAEARFQIAELCGWAADEDITTGDLRDRMETLEPVAIYAGHVFDIYQP